jgi:hypothetical protein
MNLYNGHFNPLKGFFVIIILIIIGGFIFKVGLITEAKKNDKTIYQIEVNSFNSVESYTTTEYEKEEKSGCIKFKDEFGIKHIVCNNYSITEY